jgi:acetyl esterase
MSGFTLDDEVRAFVTQMESFSKGASPEDSMETIRARYNRGAAHYARPHPAGLHVKDGVLHAANPARALAVRSYSTPDAIPGRVALFFHGGGFAVGDLESHDSICADLAAGAEVAVVALDYRVSPEAVYPAALDDAEAAYDDLIDSGQAVILVGDSAGATLAVALCHRLRRKGKAMPWAQVLIYPMLHPDPLRAKGTPNEAAPLLSTAALAWYRGLYTGGDRGVTTDPELAPLASLDVTGFPPAALFPAEHDPLVQDAYEYAAALKAADIHVTLHHGEGLVHAYLRGRAHSARIAEAFSEIVSALQRLAHSGRV